jgi:hypothetical protein
MKNLKQNLILIGLTLALIFTYSIVDAQEVKVINGKEYTIQTGSRGGKFVLMETGEKVYLPKYSAPVLTADTLATYKGKTYPVHTGSRGGRFILTETGTKVYLTANK